MQAPDPNTGGDPECPEEPRRRLLVSHPPAPDESLASYLVRLTEANGYDSPSRILRLAGIRYPYVKGFPLVFKPASDLNDLAGLVGRALHELTALTHPPSESRGQEGMASFYGAPVHKYLFCPQRGRLCPDCLRESGYCRRLWDLALVTACPRHGRLLLERCPACRQGVQITRGRVRYCRCGYDYATADTRTVPRDELALARDIGSLCDNGSSLDGAERERGKSLRDLNLSDLVLLVVFIAGQHVGILTAAGRTFLKNKDNETLHREFVRAYNVFSEYPRKFHEFLDWRQTQAGNGWSGSRRYDNGLMRSFGSFYEGLITYLTRPAFDFLRTAFGEYLTTRWQEGYAKRAGWLQAEPEQATQTHLSLTGAREQLGCDIKYLDHLMESGELETITRRMGKRRMVLVNARSLARIEHLRGGMLNRDAAALRLGISTLAVADLAARGCIHVSNTPEPRGGKVWQIKQDQIDGLLRKVRASIVPKSDPDDVMSFRAACLKASARCINVAGFVQAMLAGEIVPCGEAEDGTGFRRLVFRPADVDAYLKTYQTGKKKACDAKRGAQLNVLAGTRSGRRSTKPGVSDGTGHQLTS